MAQTLVQNVASNVVILLTTAGGAPATGIAFGALTCQFRKEGALSFTAKVLNGLNFTEIGLGFYNILFSSADLDTLGSFTVVVTGAGLSQYSEVNQVVIASQASTVPVVAMCTLTGNVLDLAGHGLEGTGVSARVLGSPELFNNGIQGYGLADTIITTKTDANGAFFLNLPRLSVVDIFISALNYRRSLTVPNLSSANLFTQVP